MDNNFPKHIAVIMDGNGRWAKKQNLRRVAGHKAGARAAKQLIESCAKRGIAVLTLFAFSTENWGRPQTEVAFLMELFAQSMKNEAKALHEANIQLRVIGSRQSLNRRLVESVEQIEAMTAGNTGLKLVIAIDYSGRWDFMQAAKSIAMRVKQGELAIENIDMESVRRSLCFGDLPEPDLFIRTSGEQRISNFMLWQMAYTELFFTDTLWPDFSEKEFEEALAFFATRNRRFGLLREKEA